MLMTKKKCDAVPDYDPDNRRYRRGSIRAAYYGPEDLRADPEADNCAQEAGAQWVAAPNQEWVARREMISREEAERRMHETQAQVQNHITCALRYGRSSLVSPDYQRAQEEVIRQLNRYIDHQINLLTWIGDESIPSTVIMFRDFASQYYKFQCTTCMNAWRVSEYDMHEGGRDFVRNAMRCPTCR